MERRGCGFGCIVAWLGLALGCCLLPYLISSVYSVVTALLQIPSVNWLWGDWLSTVIDPSSSLYMLLAEGPVCCVGAIALLITVLGLVMTISNLGQVEQPPVTEEEGYGPYAEPEASDQEME
jgi:hypothetical protein